MRKPTNEYLYCNHHHELTTDQQIVDFGTGEFVADKEMIPLLKALNELGLVTRTHCYGHETGRPFVSIIFDNRLQIEIREVWERDASRDQFNGKVELLLSWNRPEKLK